MRLLFINQHYAPDYAATAQQLTDLAEHLAAEGHDVAVLCGRGQYGSGTLEVPHREKRNGVRVHRLRTTALGRRNHLGRLAHYACFFCQVVVRLLIHRRYDYVVTLTTPPMLCLAAAFVRTVRGQHFGVWSMDLHPDAEKALGMLRHGRVSTRLLDGLNNWAHRRADFIVDLGACMKARLIEKGIARDILHTIPVWSASADVEPVALAENPVTHRLGLGEQLVVMYSGNAGLAHRFDEVLEAMQSLKDHPHIFFLFAGDGPRKKAITDFAAAHGIANFRYLDYFPRAELKFALSLGDVHLLTLRPDMAGVAVPSKLYGIMAAGRPTVMVGPEASECAQTILRERAGVLIDPQYHNGGTSRALAETLVELAERPELRKEMGNRARVAFLQRYDRAISCRKWSCLLDSLPARSDV